MLAQMQENIARVCSPWNLLSTNAQFFMTCGNSLSCQSTANAPVIIRRMPVHYRMISAYTFQTVVICHSHIVCSANVGKALAVPHKHELEAPKDSAEYGETLTSLAKPPKHFACFPRRLSYATKLDNLSFSFTHRHTHTLTPTLRHLTHWRTQKQVSNKSNTNAVSPTT